MKIKDTVEKLSQKYGTRNPFDIARQKNIIILTENLGSIRGFYCVTHRQKVIHINECLNEQEQFYTCAHELGHSILHPNLNTPFLRNNTLFSINKYENEANKFAILLLYSDDNFKEFMDLTTPKIAECLNLSQELIEYRIKQITSIN